MPSGNSRWFGTVGTSVATPTRFKIPSNAPHVQREQVLPLERIVLVQVGDEPHAQRGTTSARLTHQLLIARGRATTDQAQGQALTHRGRSLTDRRDLLAGGRRAAIRAALRSETGRFSGGQIDDVKNRLPPNSEASKIRGTKKEHVNRLRLGDANAISIRPSIRPGGSAMTLPWICIAPRGRNGDCPRFYPEVALRGLAEFTDIVRDF